MSEVRAGTGKLMQAAEMAKLAATVGLAGMNPWALVVTNLIASLHSSLKA